MLYPVIAKRSPPPSYSITFLIISPSRRILLDALYSRALLISWNHEIVPWRSKASLEFESFESNYGNISKVPYISAGYFLSSQTSSSEDFPRRSILNNVIRKWSMKITRSIAWNKIQLQRDWTETWINEIKN